MADVRLEDAILINYLPEMRQARQQTGRGVLEQLAEILRLRRSRGQIGAAEYFMFRLFESRLDFDEKARFVGWRYEREIDRVLNDEMWRAVANDKLLFYLVARGLSLPFPTIRAIYDTNGREFPGAIPLRTHDEVHGYLAVPGNLPVFVKPVWGSYGKGGAAIASYSVESGELRLLNAQTMRLTAFLEGLDDRECRGYVFQDLVVPSDFIQRVCGGRVSGLRVVVLRSSSGARIHRALWKITCGQNMSDNYHHGRTGNLLGYLDERTGQVLKVVNGSGVNLREVHRHPDTNEELLGTPIPYWSEIRERSLAAAAAFPGLRLQHWDVALSRDGPVFLELNVEGSMDFHQLPGDRGFLDDLLLEELQRR